MGVYERSLVALLSNVDIIMFGTLVTAALLLRHRPETHKRLMFLATIALLDAVFERLPLTNRVSQYAPYAILDMFVLCWILYDFVSRGRVNRAYIWGGLVIFILPPAARMIFAVTVPQTDRCWRADLEGPRRGVRL